MSNWKRWKAMWRRLKSWFVKNDAKVVLYSVMGVMALAVLAHIVAFFCLDWGGPQSWAYFGTYFSGSVTPVVALGSAFLFYRSLKIQRTELKRTSVAMERTAALHKEAVEAQNEANQLIWAEQAKKDKLYTQERRKGAVDILASQRDQYDQILGRLIPSKYGFTSKLTDKAAVKEKADEVFNQVSAANKVAEFKLNLSKLIEIDTRYADILADLLHNDRLLIKYEENRSLLIADYKLLSMLSLRFDMDNTPPIDDFDEAVNRLKAAGKPGLDV